MQAEVLSIGNEVLSGRILDTNSQWLSRRLEELGYRVRFHSAVGDDLTDLVSAFRRAAARVNLVVATGGLGPTEDDLTREALAAAFDLPLEVNQEALEQIRALFSRRQRPMPKRNELQARFPQGARPIRNPNGTAPGIELDVKCSSDTTGNGCDNAKGAGIPVEAGGGLCRIVCLPGVPAEIAEMWNDSVAGRLSAYNAGGLRIVHRQVKCFGAGESQIEAMLPEGFLRQTDPRVGINASATTIIFRISAQAETVENCRAKIEPVVAVIRERLGDLVFGEDDDELETVVGRMLATRSQTVGVIDCGCGGLLGERLAAVAAGAEIFRGCIATGGILGFDPIKDHAATDCLMGQFHELFRGGFGSSEPAGMRDPEATAKSLACAARQWWHADWGLAIGPMPPEGPNASPPRPFAIAAADVTGTVVKQFPYAGHPSWLWAWVCKQALNLLRLTLLRG